VVQIQKENEAPFGPEIIGEENGRRSLSPSDSGVWESVVSSPSGIRGIAPADNGYIVI